MRILKEIFGRIWALWTALAFIGTLLLFLIPFLLFGYFRKYPDNNRWFIKWSKYWINAFLILSLCKWRIKGQENFEAGENYIVVVNHNSFIDVPICTPAIPGPNKTIAKIEMSRIPIFGLVYKTGSVLVDRKSDSSKKDSYNQMKEVLQEGLHMCIYPEGTRNKTREPLKSFHNGAFRLAIETRKRIIPSLIFNTRKVLPADKVFYAMPHPIEIHFLPPVDIEETDTAETLKARVWEIMRNYYVGKIKS